MTGTPVGAVLAGGRGRRLGGDKAIVELDGIPLVRYPINALRSAGLDVAVVAKAGTALPDLPPGTAVWVEAASGHHPVNGLVHALHCAHGRSILAVACDLALLDGLTVRALLGAGNAAPQAAAVVPRTAGRLHPLCALYRPSALRRLAAADPDGRMTEIVLTLEPAILELDDETPLLPVNAPEDVLRASA
ncbi:MAG TPA: NTP transferase domain-containing protein, partial [Solirubrobacteraceae bacterium]|nr:NTP transferase domain-containing protein [Solirubrobacteraceae bacterium]